MENKIKNKIILSLVVGTMMTTSLSAKCYCCCKEVKALEKAVDKGVDAVTAPVKVINGVAQQYDQSVRHGFKVIEGTVGNAIGNIVSDENFQYLKNMEGALDKYARLSPIGEAIIKERDRRNGSKTVYNINVGKLITTNTETAYNPYSQTINQYISDRRKADSGQAYALKINNIFLANSRNGSNGLSGERLFSENNKQFNNMINGDQKHDARLADNKVLIIKDKINISVPSYQQSQKSLSINNVPTASSYTNIPVNESFEMAINLNSNISSNMFSNDSEMVKRINQMCKGKNAYYKRPYKITATKLHTRIQTQAKKECLEDSAGIQWDCKKTSDKVVSTPDYARFEREKELKYKNDKLTSEFNKNNFNNMTKFKNNCRNVVVKKVKKIIIENNIIEKYLNNIDRDIVVNNSHVKIETVNRNDYYSKVTPGLNNRTGNGLGSRFGSNEKYTRPALNNRTGNGLKKKKNGLGSMFGSGDNIFSLKDKYITPGLNNRTGNGLKKKKNGLGGMFSSNNNIFSNPKNVISNFGTSKWSW